MSENSSLAISIVAVISGISAGIVLILKHIKKSECSNCLKIQTRTPITLAPPPSPILNTTNKNISTNDNNNTTITIKEIEV